MASQPVLQKDAPPPPSRSRPVRQPVDAPTNHNGKRSKRGGKEGSVLASYKALPYHTKVVFCACAATFAVLGLMAAEYLEQTFPARNNRPPSKPQHIDSPKFITHHNSTPDAANATTATDATDATDATEAAAADRADRAKPRLFGISVVDRDRS